MELNTISLVSLILFHSIPISVSVCTPSPSQQNYGYATSPNPPVLVPSLETWARAMQLSFRSISESPIQSPSQFQSQSSGMISSMPYTKTQSSPSPRPPFLDGNSEVLERTMKSITWLTKLGSHHAKRLCDSSKNNQGGNMVQRVRSCKDRYDNASTNLEQAIKALRSEDLHHTRSMLKAALSNVGDCRNGYSSQNPNFPFANYHDKVTKMTTNCLTVLDLFR